MQSEPKYAGFWIRVAATLIDDVLLTLVSMPLIVAIYGDSYYASNQPAPYYYFFYGPADVIISCVLPAIAYIWFWSVYQATPGKMLVGIRIVDARTGKAPSFKQYIVRYMGYIFSGIVLCLGYIYVASDPKKQGWHDKMAGTLVIYTRSKRQGRLPIKNDKSFQA